MGRGYGGGNPPQQIKPTDIKVGDAISVMGDVDATAKSVAANRIAQLDPAVVEQIHAMEANFGKTWLMGKVTAIDGTKITLTGVLDNAPHSVVADENTAFRKRRDPITLADIQVGDTVRADGAVKDGVFTATNVNVFGGQGGETPSVPRGAPQAPQNAPPQNSPTAVVFIRSTATSTRRSSGQTWPVATNLICCRDCAQYPQRLRNSIQIDVLSEQCGPRISYRLNLAHVARFQMICDNGCITITEACGSLGLSGRH